MKKEIKNILEMYKTREEGLSLSEVKERQAKDGLNILPRKKN